MTERRIKDALLERYLAEDLTGEAKAAMESTLAESPADQARLRELRADSEAFLIRHPPARLLSQLEKPRSTRRWWWLGPALAGALAAVVVVVTTPEDEPSLYTTKGSVALTVHKKVGALSEQVGAGATLFPGDAIRFEVKAPAKGYVAVLGRDSSGQVTVYHPFDGSRADRYEPEHSLLSTAIELDDVVGREELFALYSEQPFELAPFAQALRNSQALEPIRSEVKVARTAIEKRSP